MRFLRSSTSPVRTTKPAPAPAPKAHEAIDKINDQSAYKVPLLSLEDSLAILRAAHGSGSKKHSSATRAGPATGPTPARPTHLNPLPPTSRGPASSRSPADSELPPYSMPPTYADVTNQAFDAANPTSPLFTGTQGREVHVHSLEDSVRILRAHAGRGSQ